MRILIAEDDPSLADALRCTLRKSGYAVDWIGDGRKADAALCTGEFDLLILDISLPGLSGLDAGADDYLVKPFQLAELEARARALTRRGMSGASTLIRHGRLCFDLVGRSADLGGERLDLSARELSLLELFVQRPGQLVPKERLVDHLCEWGEEVSANAIEVYVHRLRKKLAPAGVKIATVRGVGYCLEAPEGR